MATAAAASAHACLRSKLVNASRAQLCRRVLTPWSRQPAALSSVCRPASAGIAARGLAGHWPHAWAERRWLCVDASREFREVGVEHDSGAEDPYAWLEDQRTDAVRALVERENELALQALEETQGFQVRIVHRGLRCGLCSRCECVAVGLRTWGCAGCSGEGDESSP